MLRKLQKLTDAELLKWFGRNAKYHPTFPVGSQYSFRIGTGLAVFSSDTKDLFQKLQAIVRGTDGPTNDSRKRSERRENKASTPGTE